VLVFHAPANYQPQHIHPFPVPNTAINRSALSAIGFVLGQRAPGYFSVNITAQNPQFAPHMNLRSQ
jgi:hypothetical protein